MSRLQVFRDLYAQALAEMAEGAVLFILLYIYIFYCLATNLSEGNSQTTITS